MLVLGMVLAAGAGSRYGYPKALARDADSTPWLQRVVAELLAGGCADQLIVLGADAQSARELVPQRPGLRVQVVEASDWPDGMSASLRAGLQVAMQRADVTHLLVTLIDLPGVNADVVQRLIHHAALAPEALHRASFEAVAGHPVVFPRQHWNDLVASLSGDSGARDYLRHRDVHLVECADVGHGADVDTPPA